MVVFKCFLVASCKQSCGTFKSLVGISSNSALSLFYLLFIHGTSCIFYARLCLFTFLFGEHTIPGQKKNAVHMYIDIYIWQTFRLAKD